MSSFIIKLIALITMSIDHIGAVLFENISFLRFIGRISFPLYGFLLVNGFNHTKNDKKRFLNYLLRILLLGVITEPFYDKLFYNTYFYISNQNILFTLFVALLCMYIYEKNEITILHKITSILIVCMIALLSQLFLDYGFCGIFLIFSFYLISKFNIKDIYKIILYFIIMFLYLYIFKQFYITSYTLYGTLLSLIPICLYNGEKGYDSIKLSYFFYLYYPLHIILLLIIKSIV